MQVLVRRTLLAGAGTLAAVSLASVVLLRKPPNPVVLTPVHETPRLRPLADLQVVKPPTIVPAIVFADATGASHGLAEFIGRGLVLNVWATWCAPCVAEMPALAKLAAGLADAGIVVLPLSIDRGGATVVQRFYAEHHIAGLGVWNDSTGDAGRALGVNGVPTTLVIDRHGRQTGLFEGAADWGSDAALARIRALV